MASLYCPLANSPRRIVLSWRRPSQDPTPPLYFPPPVVLQRPSLRPTVTRVLPPLWDPALHHGRAPARGDGDLGARSLRGPLRRPSTPSRSGAYRVRGTASDPAVSRSPPSDLLLLPARGATLWRGRALARGGHVTDTPGLDKTRDAAAALPPLTPHRPPARTPSPTCPVDALSCLYGSWTCPLFPRLGLLQVPTE